MLAQIYNWFTEGFDLEGRQAARRIVSLTGSELQLVISGTGGLVLAVA